MSTLALSSPNNACMIGGYDKTWLRLQLRRMAWNPITDYLLQFILEDFLFEELANHETNTHPNPIIIPTEAFVGKPTPVVAGCFDLADDGGPGSSQFIVASRD